jgi:hypothetical protein
LTEKLQRDIFDYFQYWWVNTRGFQTHETQHLFAQLPTTTGLRREAKVALLPNACTNVLSTLSVFTRTGVIVGAGEEAGQRNPLIQDLVNCMTRVFAVRGEYVVRMDEFVSALYIVYK